MPPGSCATVTAASKPLTPVQPAEGGVQSTVEAIADAARIESHVNMNTQSAAGREQTGSLSSSGLETTLVTRVNTGKKQSSVDRLQRSRERNRMHARKTRQRKKEHMQNLQNRADELKNEQLKLKQIINEKNTANILLGMFSTSGNVSDGAIVDPKIEEILKRAPEDIPDASKIPELPALILPGQHNGKKTTPASSSGDGAVDSKLPQHEQLPDDGIDYDLLGKDRSKCTPAELDKIRRERNRMHAKRTRDRKRIFMEEMEEMIKGLERENELLRGHVDSLGPACSSTVANPAIVSPTLEPSKPVDAPVVQDVLGPAAAGDQAPAVSAEPEKGVQDGGAVGAVSPEPVSKDQSATHKAKVDQIKSLLAAAGAFDDKKNFIGMLAISSAASAVSASTTPSVNGSVLGDDDQDDTSLSNRSLSPRPSKRQCVEGVGSDGNEVASIVPTSITTSTPAC